MVKFEKKKRKDNYIIQVKGKKGFSHLNIIPKKIM